MACCCKFKLNNRNYVWIRWFRLIPQLGELLYMCFMKVLGPLMFGAANILILAVAVLFQFIITPELTGNDSRAYFIRSVINIYLVVNIFYNYYSCAFTHAGSPSSCADPSRVLGEKCSVIDGERVFVMNQRKIVAPYVAYKYCHDCEAIKPPRAHHCRVSGACIYDMDHYCPWMNNCVGHFNYRYFLLFLFYMCVGTSYVIYNTLADISSRLNNKREIDQMTVMFHTNIFKDHRISARMFCFTICLSAVISVGILLVWHGYLVLTNQTTIEFYINWQNSAEAKLRGKPYKNPYDEGSWRKNLRRIFGDVPWYRHLFPSNMKPVPPKYQLDLGGETPLEYYSQV